MIVSSVDRAALENLDPRLVQELIREFRLLFWYVKQRLCLTFERQV